MEPEEKSRETLQQSVVQLARDAGALTHSRFERPIELSRELPDTEFIAAQSKTRIEAPHAIRNQVVW